MIEAMRSSGRRTTSAPGAPPPCRCRLRTSTRPRGRSATTAIGYIATGVQYAAGVAETPTWISDDGRTWRLADVQAATDLNIDVIASGPAGTLGFGSVRVSDGVYQFNVWRLVRTA